MSDVMYPVPDEDLEFLESYLDDALSDEETDALRHRLACEPNLVSALRMLREERSQRQAYFQTIDPTPKEVEQLVGAIHASAHRQQWWRDQRNLVQWGSAVAACLAIGLLGGLFYRGSEKAPLHPASIEQVAEGKAPIGISAPTTDVRFPVELTDENGKVIAVQHFEKASEAAEFSNDLRHMQNRGKQNSGGVMLIENHDF